MDLIREMWKHAFACTAFSDAEGCAREAARLAADGDSGGGLVMRMLVQGMIVSYALPFRQRRTVRLGEDIVDPGRLGLHRRLLELRDRAVTHRDPVAVEGFDNSVEIVRGPGGWLPVTPPAFLDVRECAEAASLAADLSLECGRRLDGLAEAVGGFRDLSSGAVSVRPVQEGGRTRYVIEPRATEE